MAVNHVVADGETIIDLRDATATAADILSGYTAYGASGALLYGTASKGSKTQKTVSLSPYNWSSLTQTVSVSGVTYYNDVAVEATSNADEYQACGVKCTSQGNGALTFTADWQPSVYITVTVTIFDVG